MLFHVKFLAAVILMLVSGAGVPGASDRRGERPDAAGRHEGPQIRIEPYVDLSRRGRVNVDTPEFIMAELGRCTRAGVRLLVDCLRPNHRPVLIRRLEACVQSETIPDDPQRVAVCLPASPLR